MPSSARIRLGTPSRAAVFRPRYSVRLPILPPSGWDAYETCQPPWRHGPAVGNSDQWNSACLAALAGSSSYRWQSRGRSNHPLRAAGRHCLSGIQPGIFQGTLHDGIIQELRRRWRSHIRHDANMANRFRISNRPSIIPSGACRRTVNVGPRAEHELLAPL